MGLDSVVDLGFPSTFRLSNVLTLITQLGLTSSTFYGALAHDCRGCRKLVAKKPMPDHGN